MTVLSGLLVLSQTQLYQKEGVIVFLYQKTLKTLKKAYFNINQV